MTRDDFKMLPKGARVMVVKSGKVYEVTYPGRLRPEAERTPEFNLYSPDGWTMPDFQQWRTGEDKYPNGRLYGPAFVRLQPENVRSEADLRADLRRIDPQLWGGGTGCGTEHNEKKRAKLLAERQRAEAGLLAIEKR